MQAVMFCVMGMGGGGASAEAGGVTSGQLPPYAIDFWWVKPQVHPPYISPTSPLPLPHISPCLPDLSPISALHLPHISP